MLRAAIVSKRAPTPQKVLPQALKHPEIFEKRNVPITATLRYAETPCSFSESWFHAPSDAIGRTRPAMVKAVDGEFLLKLEQSESEVMEYPQRCVHAKSTFSISLYTSKEDNCQHVFWVYLKLLESSYTSLQHDGTAENRHLDMFK